MSRASYVVHEEITPWPAWVVAIMWVACLMGAASALGPALRRLMEGGSLGPVLPALAGGVALLLVPLVARFLFGRLRVRVTRTSVHLSFGSTSLISKVIPFDEIRSMEAVDYSPLMEFGGWGIRYRWGGKRAWTIRGSRALVLHLEDGKHLYVGSDNPEGLAAHIRLVADIPGPAR